MNTEIIGFVKLGAGLLLATLIVLFTVQNVQAAEIKFLIWKMNLSLSLLIFASVAVGIASGWLLASWMHYRRKREKVRAAKAG